MKGGLEVKNLNQQLCRKKGGGGIWQVMLR